jgi:glycosyltransferase involved in cell wall biosynthesis
MLEFFSRLWKNNLNSTPESQYSTAFTIWHNTGNRFLKLYAMIKTKKLAVIGTVGIPARYGGFETLTEHLVKQLGEKYNITVYCSKKKYPKETRRKTFLNARLKYLPFNANGIQSILYDTLSILHALFYADVLLILGVAGAWTLPLIRLLTNKKIIISIDGIEWRRNKWSRTAKWYLWWSENIAVKYSHADISDNESIQDYTAVRYGTLSNIIEYGADHTLSVKTTVADKEQYAFLTKTYAFKVCRIEPENNIDIVLEAFSTIPLYTLVMIGNWNNSNYGKEIRAQYERFTNLILLDPIYDQRTLDVIRGNAHVYIHGHSAGGTNPSLVEAMYLALPIITYDVSYNRTTTENKALYFKTADDIVQIIKNTRLQELKEKSMVMKEIADRRYTWKVIADKYDYLIQKVLKTKKKIKVQPSISMTHHDSLLEYGLAHLQNPDMFYEKR